MELVASGRSEIESIDDVVGERVFPLVGHFM